MFGKRDHWMRTQIENYEVIVGIYCCILLGTLIANSVYYFSWANGKQWFLASSNDSSSSLVQVNFMYENTHVVGIRIDPVWTDHKSGIIVDVQFFEYRCCCLVWVGRVERMVDVRLTIKCIPWAIIVCQWLIWILSKRLYQQHHPHQPRIIQFNSLFSYYLFDNQICVWIIKNMLLIVMTDETCCEWNIP